MSYLAGNLVACESSEYHASHTTCRIKSPGTSLTLEVFGLLMIDKDLEVVEIPLAVIAPWPCERLFDVRMLALAFTHG